jgi:phospholipase C
MNGLVSSFAVSLRRQPTSSELQQVMNCFDPVQLPVLSILAKNFVLCDRWFVDVPGPTMPNRAFVHAATLPCSAGLNTTRAVAPFWACRAQNCSNAATSTFASSSNGVGTAGA